MPLTYIKQEVYNSHFKIKHFQPPSFWPSGPTLTPSKAQKASNSTKLTRSHGSRLLLFKIKANNTFKMTLKNLSHGKFCLSKSVLTGSHDQVDQMGRSSRSQPVLLAALILFAVPWLSCLKRSFSYSYSSTYKY